MDEAGVPPAEAVQKSAGDEAREILAAVRASLDAGPPAPAPKQTVAEVLKSFWKSFLHPRAPKGSPHGGKFIGKDSLPPEDPGPKPGVKWTPMGGENMQPLPGFNGGFGPKPAPRSPNAVKHPGVDDKGDAVWIDEPTRPSPQLAWKDPNLTATFVPNGHAPEVLNGVPMKPWADAPRTKEGWAAVPGQNLHLELGLPTLTAPKGKSIGAGVVIEEPDGRVWIVSPTNGFGGYRQTFPKGTAEEGIPSLQANAIKEAYEESGLQIEITGVIGDFSRTTSVARFYTARRVGGTPVAMGWESQAARLAPPEHLKRWLNRADVDHPVVEAWEKRFGVAKAKGGGLKAVANAVIGGGKFDSSKHPRYPVGHPKAGEFMPKAGGDAGGGKGGAFSLPEPPKIGWKKDGSGVGANATYHNKMQAALDAANKGDFEPAKKLMVDYDSFAEKLAAGEKLNSHGKWKAQVADWAAEVVMAQGKMKSLGTQASALEGKSGPASIANWTKVGEKPGGSAPGGIYTDESGQKWLVKGNLQGKDDDRARNEVLTSKLQAAAGIPSAEYRLVDLGGEYGGGLGVAVKWEDGLKKLSDSADMAQARSQFAVHAWTGNWDVVGLSNDNLMRRKNGDVVNIDPGGALLYRAQGTKKKPGDFGPDASDWDSMRDHAKNAQAASMFKPMTADDLKNSAMKLQGVTDDAIIKLVEAHGPGDKAAKADLTMKLIARRDDILAKNGLDAADTAPAPKPKATPAPKPAAEPEAKAPLNAGEVTKPKFTLDGPLKAQKEIDSYPAFTGGPDPAMAPAFDFLENEWTKKAAGMATGQEKWEATQMAAYTANMKAYHEGKFDPKLNSLEVKTTAKASYTYDAGEDFEYDADAFGGGIDKYFAHLNEKAPSAAPAKAPEPKPVRETKTAKPAPTPAPDAPKPAAPDWEASKTTSAANPGHNVKVDKIKSLFDAGDADGIAALPFGTNTYGKKQAALANNALKALGSDKTVTPGQGMKGGPKPAAVAAPKADDGDTSWVRLGKNEKVVEHGVDFGVKWAKIEVAPKGFDPKGIPNPPNFFTNGSQGPNKTWKSSSEAINTANNNTVNEVYKAATTKGANTANIESMKVHKTDKASGAKTDELVPVKDHPATVVKDYHAEVVAELKAQVEPTFKTIQSGSFTASYSDAAAKLASRVKAVATAKVKGWAQKAADYLVLDTQAAAKLPMPKPGLFKNVNPGDPALDAFGAKSKEILAGNSELAALLKSYSGSSYDSWNAAMRAGTATGSAATLQKKFAEAAVDLPEGIVLHRGIGVGKSTYDSVVGAIIQDGSLQSSSYGASAAFKNKPTQLRLHVGKGVKALDITGTSIFGTGEREIVLAPNTRYAVMKVENGPGGKTYVDILVLPH